MLKIRIVESDLGCNIVTDSVIRDTQQGVNLRRLADMGSGDG